MEEPETQEAVKVAVEEHKRMVIGDQMQRQQDCMKVIQKTLDKYGCSLVPRCMLHPNGMEWMVEAIAKPKEALEAEQLQKEKKQKEMEDARKAGSVRKKGKGKPKKEGEKG